MSLLLLFRGAGDGTAAAFVASFLTARYEAIYIMANKTRPRLEIKDPDAGPWPKGIDWGSYLDQIDSAETISTSVWSISGPDSSLTVSTSSIVTGSTKTQAKLTGGTLGATYTVTNRITTSSGVVDDRSFDVLIEQR